MNDRSRYKTKQREKLIQYLSVNGGKHVTACDAAEYLKEQGVSIGQSTVYRQLESLVDEGIVNKYTVDSMTSACFEYVDPGRHEKQDVCFHCKCVQCGRLIHLHCDELNEIEEHLFKEHRFKMNPYRTVFYGLCEDCMKGENA